MYFNARYYSQTLGRFVSADSIVPGAGNPQAFNRYAFVFNNPLRYIDPTGHASIPSCAGKPDCGVDDEDDNGSGFIVPGNPVQPALTPPGPKFDHTKPYGGADVKALFDMMVAETSGWWYSKGTFALEGFLGLMLLHEAAGNLEWLTQIAQATAQQLYVGGNKPAYCPAGPCVNGVFNFLAAYSESVHRLVDTYVRGGTSILKYQGYGRFALEGASKIQQRLGAATTAGTQALHPKTLNLDRYNAPTDWGNFPAVNAVLNINNAQVGTGRDQIYYRSPDKIVYVQTTRQNNYWNGVIAK
jgi:hypothetical protein